MNGFPIKYRLSKLIDGHGTPCPYELHNVIKNIR